ncbi:hypothetical protein BDV96DRAFT_604427 [Lophiotrema nucula]|uniref:Uncharacterized protein n=1 Tax=Lophiotrema nucula TaxID=690887 RepID=A0A6A5YRX7_9PLEO|nr:hypothetical protein BDV96DRAFT_604427 [Lophiotrema nucula]
MKFQTATLFAVLPTTFAALPDVTAKPLPDGCSSYPAYNTDTGVAGPWNIQAFNTENIAIEGFTDTNIYSISIVNRKPTMRWGFITFPTRNDIAKTRIQCSDGSLQAYTDSELTDAGEPVNVQWLNLQLNPYPYDQSIMYKIDDGEPIKAFEHYIGDEKQDGVYLGGYDNSTAWGFKYEAVNAGSSGQDYYYVRLLGPNSADSSTGAPLQVNETRGFIKVAA